MDGDDGERTDDGVGRFQPKVPRSTRVLVDFVHVRQVALGNGSSLGRKFQSLPICLYVIV